MRIFSLHWGFPLEMCLRIGCGGYRHRKCDCPGWWVCLQSARAQPSWYYLPWANLILVRRLVQSRELNPALAYPNTCPDHHCLNTPTLSLRSWFHVGERLEIIGNSKNWLTNNMSMEVFPFRHTAFFLFTATWVTDSMKRQGGSIPLPGLLVHEKQNAQQVLFISVFWKKVIMQIPRNIWCLHPHSTCWWYCFTVGKIIEKSSNRAPVIGGTVSIFPHF